jgi:hypothetical protein
VDSFHDLIHVLRSIKPRDGKVRRRPGTVHSRVLQHCVLLKAIRVSSIVESDQIRDRYPAIENLAADEHVERGAQLELPVISQ